MGIEKLNISRGHELPLGDAARAGKPATPSAPAKPSVRAEPVQPVSLPIAHALVHARLDALERLTRLFEQGTLSAEEFAAEKATILRLPADERTLRYSAGRRSPPEYRGPSLLGRLLNLKLLLAGLAVGIGVSYAVQPRETLDYLEQGLRMIGI